MVKQTDKDESSQSRACQFLAGSATQHSKWLQQNLAALDGDFFEELKELYLDKLRAGSDDARLLFERFDALPSLELEPKAHAFASWLRAVNAFFHGSPQDAYCLYLKAKNFITSSNDYVSQIKLHNSTILSAISSGYLREAQSQFHEAETVIGTGKIRNTDRQHLAPLYKSYALLQDHMGDHHQAERYLQLASNLADEFQMAELLVYIRTNQAYSMALTGQLVRARDLFKRNLLAARETGLASAEAKTNMHLGSVYTQLGQPANALSHYQLARDQFLDLNSPPNVVTAQLLEGDLFEKIGALSQALFSFKSAYVQAKNLNSSFDVGDATLRIATIYRKIGEPRQAKILLSEGLEIWQAMGQPEYCIRTKIEHSLLESTYGDPTAALRSLTSDQETLEEESVLQLDMQLALGYIYRQLHLLDRQSISRDKANKHYHHAIRIAKERSDQIHLRQALVELAEHTLSTDVAKAAHYFEAAAELGDTLRQELSVQELKASYQESTGQVLPRLAHISLQQGNITQAIHYVWRAKGSAMLDLLQSDPLADSGSTQHIYPEKFRTTFQITEMGQNFSGRPYAPEINQIRQELSALRWQLTHTTPEELTSFARTAMQNQISELRQTLYELRRQRNEANAASWNLSTLKVGEVLEAKDASLLIEYIVCDNKVLAFIADKNAWLYAGVVSDLEQILVLQEELYLSFQSFLLQSHNVQSSERSLWEEEYLTLLSALSTLLIPIDLTAYAQKAILIAPCTPLHTVPFSALRVDDSFLIESHDLLITPTAALGCLAYDEETGSDKTLLIGSSAENRLQAVRTEIDAIAILSANANCWVDQANTSQMLSALQAAPSVLHIAAHAEIDTEAPILSYLELHDELLTIEQIYDLKLRCTDLVTLSACNTASNMDTGGALLAFQSAFFIAGARSVLCSLWPVDDQATARWMSEFYTQYHNGHSSDEALAKAQRLVLADPDYYHPAFWAAFSCNSR